MTRITHLRSRRAAAAAGAAAALAIGLLPGALAAPAQAATPLEFEREVLTTSVQDPTRVEVAPDGDVYIAERKGTVKVWRQDRTLVTAGVLPTSAARSANTPELEEGGLHGLLLAQDFATSRTIYLYRSLTKDSVDPATGDGKFRLSSFHVNDDDTLDMASEKTILEVPAEWSRCCHYGGDMAWDDKGAILLTVGDDTSPRDEGWNPRDKRPGRQAFDADRTSQNPADRRGKVLRLMPDGSVPADNPHVADPRFDPYVFSSGWRSNYSISFDRQTRLTFIGNVGNDANADDANRGPHGYDELGIIAPGGGDNHGWPRCIANNKPYRDYDYSAGTSGALLECKDATTGKPFTPDPIYYRGTSTDFPQIGPGAGGTIVTGPVYRATKGALRLPASFQNKLIFADQGRSYMYTVDLDAAGTTVVPSTIQPFSASVNTPAQVQQAAGTAGVRLPGGPPRPLDMSVGPDGALYVAEYGSGFYDNTNSAISRLICTGCRPSSADYGGAPVAAAPAAAAGTTSAGGASGVLGAGAVASIALPLALVGLVRRRRVA